MLQWELYPCCYISFCLFLHYVIHERLLLEDKYIWSISKLLYNLDCSLLSLSPSFLYIHFYRGYVRNVIQIIKAHNMLKCYSVRHVMSCQCDLNLISMTTFLWQTDRQTNWHLPNLYGSENCLSQFRPNWPSWHSLIIFVTFFVTDTGSQLTF